MTSDIAKLFAEHPLMLAALGDDESGKVDITILAKLAAQTAKEADDNFNEEKKAAGGNKTFLRSVPKPIDPVQNYDEDDLDDGDAMDEEDMELDEECDDFEEDDELDEEEDDASVDDENGEDNQKSPVWKTNEELLCEAAASTIESGNMDALKCIVESISGTATKLSTASPSTGGTLLHVAAGAGQTEMLSYLLDKAGLKPFINDAERFDSTSTPLHWAAIHGQTECCRVLIANGVHKDVRNRDKYTALHLALEKGHSETFKALVDGGCNPNVPNEDGHTCLHLLLGDLRDDELAAYLVGLKRDGKTSVADINARDVVGWTPLALAVTENNTDLAKILLSTGASLAYGDEEDDDVDEESADLPLITIAAARNHNVELVRAMLEGSTKDEAINSLKSKDATGKTTQEWITASLKSANGSDREALTQIQSIIRENMGKRQRE